MVAVLAVAQLARVVEAQLEEEQEMMMIIEEERHSVATHDTQRNHQQHQQHHQHHHWQCLNPIHLHLQPYLA